MNTLLIVLNIIFGLILIIMIAGYSLQIKKLKQEVIYWKALFEKLKENHDKAKKQPLKKFIKTIE